MSTETPITREGVEFAYRFLLGRPPENEKAYEYGLSAGTVEALRRWIMASPEFADKLHRDAPIVFKRWLAKEREGRAVAKAPAPPANAADPSAPAEPPTRPARPARAVAPARAAAQRARAAETLAAVFARHVVIHTHIEKCAGSSVIEGFRRLFGPPACLDLRAADAPRPAKLPPEHRARIRLLTGHIHHGGHEEAFGRQPLYIATVRDPVARLVSFLGFLRRSVAHPEYARYAGVPVEEAVRRMVSRRYSFVGNGQCMALARTPSFEAARASIERNYLLVLPHASANRIPALFADAFGLPRPKQVIWVNATPAKPPEIVPDEALAAHIHSLNAEDDRLYHWVLENEEALLARATERLAALAAAAAPPNPAQAAAPDQNTKRVPTSTDRPGAAKPLAGS
ncbi:hypothetical protein [Falsiroseomonas sp.]|uniref:hypothetical protein n=1 Tax=Falsiroseomonas sp. TaxID=2870721 RepID=UPI003566789A